MEELKPSAVNSAPLTPIGFLERAATAYGDCPSIIYNNTTYTWSQTNRRCLQVASSLSSYGITRGHVVAVVAPNIPAVYELQFAVPMSGAILHSINTRLDASTISILLLHSESKLVFVDCLSRDLILEAVSLFPPNTKRPTLVLITDDADAAAAQSSSLTAEFSCSYESMVEKGDPGFKWVRPQSEWDPVVLNYTSGTTSSPKGVVQSHRSIFIMSVAALIDWSVPEQPVYLWVLPIFHVNGWSYPWGMAAVGGTNICLRKVEASTIYSLIERHGVTHMCGAPVVLTILTASPNVKPLKNPVHILTSGAPPPPAVLLRTESLGFVVTHAYGLTEAAGPAVSCAWKPEWNTLPASERARLKARQGVAMAGSTEMDVLDPTTGESVKRDGISVGEVVLRGGSVMLGYLKDPIGTSKCMKDGWFYTGDVGVVHQDGYLEIKDRSKDVIISGGENISSVEVESVLYTHPDVHEAAVVARPDEFWGETPCAFVGLKDGLDKKPCEKDIIDFCRKNMPHFMVPKTVVFKDELPKTSTGKIKKFVLKEIAKGMGPEKLEISGTVNFKRKINYSNLRSNGQDNCGQAFRNKASQDYIVIGDQGKSIPKANHHTPPKVREWTVADRRERRTSRAKNRDQNVLKDKGRDSVNHFTALDVNESNTYEGLDPFSMEAKSRFKLYRKKNEAFSKRVSGTQAQVPFGHDLRQGPSSSLVPSPADDPNGLYQDYNLIRLLVGQLQQAFNGVACHQVSLHNGAISLHEQVGQPVMGDPSNPGIPQDRNIISTKSVPPHDPVVTVVGAEDTGIEDVEYVNAFVMETKSGAFPYAKEASVF
ncbi:unnamed protein product [Dovyalis caffra]|uniref:4-coumarate--CoA ligase n=1 Tax=Dovyalis caffra TaxID=77055 RepID=A0AAV1S4X0_9ROSI|nr:unnamed protein product [Dovyalis caffra]